MGYPQDWIHVLGPSILKVHLKDFKRREDGYEWVNLGDGDVDWAAVRQAFADVGYSGNVIAELKGGDETYLKDMVTRINRLLLITLIFAGRNRIIVIRRELPRTSGAGSVRRPTA
jgi:hexulose-6-phosphate isomerase